MKFLDIPLENVGKYAIIKLTLAKRTQGKEVYQMHFRRGHYEMDMTTGSILPKLLMFSLPLMLSSILQLLFNAADVIVVGRFEGENALAAVGSTGALINLIVNLFMGLSVGANVVIARYYGAGELKDTSRAVHTSVTISMVSGVILAVFGFLMARTFLVWMGSPDDVLPLAALYMRIYFLGMPFNMLYNFGAAVLRAVGDTQRPLIFLMLAGVINVILNLIFVIVLHIGVAGVALATIISQGVSATLVLLCLLRSEGAIHVNLRKLGVDLDKLKEITRIGLPAGLQGVFFSLSNVLIQSTVNSFGSIVVAGNSVSANIEGFIYVAMNAMHQAAITFTSQNLGAQKYVRIRKVCLLSVLSVTVIGIALGCVALLFKDALLSIYSDVPEVIAAGEIRLLIIASTYFLCGIMDVLCGALRGLGSTVLPMVVSILGACAFRIFWIYCVLPFNRTLNMLYISYPVSWIITAAVHAVCFARMLRRFPVSAGLDAPNAAA